MSALLTITHHEGFRESYVLECPHGTTNGEADTVSADSKERLISSLLSRHGVPFGCTCAAETDLMDAYPSIESAVDQIRHGPGHGPTELDEDVKQGLLDKIADLACPACSVAILVLPLRTPLVVVPVHDVMCPNATWSPAPTEELD